MNKESNTNHHTCLTDPKLFAAAVVLGGTLEKVDYDPGSNRVTFYLSGLPATFVQDCFSNKLTIPLTPYLDAIERAYALITQYKARGRR